MNIIYINPGKLGRKVDRRRSEWLVAILGEEGWPVRLGEGPDWEFDTEMQRVRFQSALQGALEQIA